MTVRELFVTFVAARALLLVLAAPSPAAAAPSQVANPDFTRGDEIPAGANHDWTLGATGARGWMYSDKLVTTDARQIAITEVEKDSPAGGILLGYGAHAKSTIPELKQIADYFENDEENFPRKLSLEKAKVVREAIRAIEASDEYPELIRIE